MKIVCKIVWRITVMKERTITIPEQQSFSWYWPYREFFYLLHLQYFESDIPGFLLLRVFNRNYNNTRAANLHVMLTIIGNKLFSPISSHLQHNVFFFCIFINFWVNAIGKTSGRLDFLKKWDLTHPNRQLINLLGFSPF